MNGKASEPGEIIPRQVVQWFSLKMEQELCENDHKGGWKGISEKFAIEKLTEEFHEVINAIKEREHPDEIISECADLANIAMMIADVINNARDSYKEAQA